MGRIKSSYNWQNTGRMAYWDSVTYETIRADYPVFFYDDFIGSAGGDIFDGTVTWKTIDSGASTEAITADGTPGLFALTGTNADEKQVAKLYMNDQRMFDITKGLIFEARVNIAVLPTGNGEIQFGLAGDEVEDPNSISYSVWFDLDGSGVVNVATDDNSTDTETATTTTVVAGTYYIFRIDCTDVTNIRFFINGALVNTVSQPYAATGANAILQPYFSFYKVSGTGVGTASIDYVKIWQNRS